MGAVAHADQHKSTPQGVNIISCLLACSTTQHSKVSIPFTDCLHHTSICRPFKVFAAQAFPRFLLLLFFFFSLEVTGASASQSCCWRSLAVVTAGPLPPLLPGCCSRICTLCCTCASACLTFAVSPSGLWPCSSTLRALPLKAVARLRMSSSLSLLLLSGWTDWAGAVCQGLRACIECVAFECPHAKTLSAAGCADSKKCHLHSPIELRPLDQLLLLGPSPVDS